MTIDNVITYLQTKINADTGLPSGIKVLKAYKYGHKPQKSEVQVQIIDGSEDERFTTFENGKIMICPLQIDTYGVEETVGTGTSAVTYNAQDFTDLLTSKIQGYLDPEEMHTTMTDVLSARNGTYQSSRPLDTGINMYRGVVRIDLYLE